MNAIIITPYYNCIVESVFKYYKNNIDVLIIMEVDSFTISKMVEKYHLTNILCFSIDEYLLNKEKLNIQIVHLEWEEFSIKLNRQINAFQQTLEKTIPFNNILYGLDINRIFRNNFKYINNIEHMYEGNITWFDFLIKNYTCVINPLLFNIALETLPETLQNYIHTKLLNIFKEGTLT